MAEFQEQLRQYRQQKHKRDLLTAFKTKVKNFWMLGTGADSAQRTIIDVKPEKTHTESATIYETVDDNVAWSEDDEPLPQDNLLGNEKNESKGLKYTLWCVYFLFWVTLYVIAIELKFGLVFLMFSALLGIYFNTRTGPKKSNEISAYSVFNKNCESIDGTLKAEQFEKEIRFGSGAVR